jgi:hypothetical protein
MSNRWPRIHDPDEGQRGIRSALRDRYFPPERGGKASPIVTIILILAAFTCLFICAILMLVPLQWLFSWAGT